MNKLKIALFSASLSALAGCFTIHETPYPVVQMTSAPENQEIRVAIAGFEATVTDYIPVRTYSTVWRDSPGYYRRGHYHGGYYHPETVTSTTYIPQVSVTTAYAERATDALESVGFLVGVTNADYIVEVKFSGPSTTGGECAAEFATVLFSIFTADYSVQTWGARLKVRDVRSGRVVLSTDYTERYAVTVWGPIPIFSPAFATETGSGAIQDRCLSALTDMAISDASAFIASRTASPIP